MPEGTTGIVLKRKFPKEENEEYYSEYIYSAWIYCEKEEIEGEIEMNLNLDFDPLCIDWLGKQGNLLKNSKINLTSTPIFLIENNGNYTDSLEDNLENSEKIEENDKKNNTQENANLFVYLNICIFILSLILTF